MYLSKVGDSSFSTQVFQHVGYGTMSKYLALPVATYAVAMRGEGAPASDPAILTTQVTVTDGGAFTVAGVGKYGPGLGLKVLTDDLSRPANGKAKVRVIQASVAAPVLDVDLTDGTPVAKSVTFASTTNYQVVEPGTWTLRLRPNGTSSTTTLSVDLAGGCWTARPGSRCSCGPTPAAGPPRRTAASTPAAAGTHRGTRCR